jgi:beta-lactam-binding protein with PASTA domain
LRGMTVDKAKETLNRLGLEMDPDLIQTTDRNIGSGMIARTEPAAKAQVERQSRIRLYVSGPPQVGGGTSSVEGGFVYTIRVSLDDLRRPTQVRIDMVDSRGTTQIFDEERNPGDRVEVSALGSNPTATFQIYYDGALVKTVPAEAG